MNSKKKNKNRQNKPPNPTPPQKKEEVIEPVSPPEEKVESVVEERVPNIVSENVPVEVKESEDTPKKPKRNRGKKKKEDEKSDKEDEIKIEEPIPEPEIQPVKDELDETNIAPTARKKKNKNKKNQDADQKEDAPQNEAESEIKVQECETKFVEVQKIEETETETKSSKKKNKKKKNRNDSEKSEKEEVSCTSAFQTLLMEDEKSSTKQTGKTAQPTTDSEVTVKAVEVELETQKSVDVKTQEETIQKDESSKNKKKNKKDKKNPPEEVFKPSETIDIKKIKEALPEAVEKPIETHKENTETVEVEHSIPSTSATEESPKIQAKIAKPVDKKKKGKGHSEKVFEEKSDSVKEEKAFVVQPLPEAVLAESITSPSVTQEEIVPQADTSPDWHEEVKSNEGNGPLVGCEDKNEITTLLTENLAQHKKGKKSSKSPKKNETVIHSEVPIEVTTRLPEPDASKVLDESGSSTQQPGPFSEELHQVSPETTPLTVEPQEEKVECTKTPVKAEKKQKGKKSPKPQRKDEILSPEMLTDVTQPDIVKVIETTKSSTEEKELKTDQPVIKAEVKTEQLLETNQDVLVDSKEAIKDEKEHIKKPDSENRQMRKKSPKPSINIDVASSSKNTEKTNKLDFNIDDLIIIQAEVVSDEKALTSEAFIAAEEDKVKKHDDMQKITVKSDIEKSKKRKKSPKPPKRETAIDSKSDSKNIEVTETQPEVQTPLTPMVGDIKLSPDIVPVELETPKVDLTALPSEITPDFIEYPRCSSEQLSDNNNNTVIQEISPSETKLEVPIVLPETPFIKSTDLLTPELSTSGTNVTNLEPKKLTQEKTDLKSKVMEVNQDMEELRLSIEKSLAELTCLEKTDQEAEKHMKEQNKRKTEKTETVEAKPDLPAKEQISDPSKSENQGLENIISPVTEEIVCQEPICPERKDRKGKGKSNKKKGKQDTTQSSTSQSTSTTSELKESTQSQDTKKEDSSKSDQKPDSAQEKGKQQTDKKGNKDDDTEINSTYKDQKPEGFEEILNFEDAMTSSADDVNQSFEIIANEANPRLNVSQNNPEINIIAPQEDDKNGRQEKQNPVSPPKNLLGHPDVPVSSNKTDYKKEKNKTPNYRQAKVKIKDANHVEIESPEKSKQSKESQTENKRKFSSQKNADESICVTNKNEDYVYKYSFRKVFLQCACHVCKKDLTQTRVPCSFCNLIFYCNQKHKDEDYAQHQALCFAVSTIVHLKDQKFIYADARNITGHNYRLLRMQMIVSCEKVLKRRLVPWEQEALLYPRICADAGCREWKQGMLRDCEGCGQISYCSDHPDHLPKLHARWCKSYNLYRSLVRHQQTRGRLEPKLPTRVVDLTPLPDNINEVLANMYEERIDMSDIEYAALTQLATAPLTALYCLHSYNKISKLNGVTKKSTLTLHIVGAELQFEADVLNKWEVFLLHLVPDVKELRVVLVGPDLNPSNLPLDLLGKIKLCQNCQQHRRRVLFSFQDKRTYHEFWASDDFTTPDLVCAFNPSIHRSSTYTGKDSWPSTINCILKLKIPFAITSYTLSELNSDLLSIQECAGNKVSVVCAPKNNSFASVRPDRNFISDDEAPLLFKNHCVTVVCGV